VEPERARDGGRVFDDLPRESTDQAYWDSNAVFLGYHNFVGFRPGPTLDEAIAVATGVPWSLALFQTVHRAILERTRPEIAGKLRDPNTAIGDRLIALGNETMEFARGSARSHESVSHIFEQAARLYQWIVAAQLFERGNEYWGRAMVNILLRNCGFYPGTQFPTDQTRLDFEVFLVTADHDPKPLAQTLLNGFLAQRECFRKAAERAARP
jgi:Fic/DOC family protein